ncbi:MAG: hypothetical protein H6R11_521 [Proteobacteria bacterium]|nr:hypothetical protein [Pseudomonadota bacterium]
MYEQGEIPFAYPLRSNKGGGPLVHPPSPFTGQFLRTAATKAPL